jgi:hypothetical protein
MDNPREENSGRGEFLQKFYLCRQEIVIYFFLSQIWVFLFFLTGIVQIFAVGLYFYELVSNTIRIKEKWKQTLPDF